MVMTRKKKSATKKGCTTRGGKSSASEPMEALPMGNEPIAPFVPIQAGTMNSEKNKVNKNDMGHGYLLCYG